MCLIVVAHRVSEHYPFVVAANRDEAYSRPSLPLHRWSETPHVIGGRDALQGGSWLAMTEGGRFAAVTNLRGGEQGARSRGFLVRDFVTGSASAGAYAERVVREAADYSGFHLLVGLVASELLLISGGTVHRLAPGVHGLSNAPAEVEWPKVRLAASHMRSALEREPRAALVEDLLAFLSTPRGSSSVEEEVFIRGEQYGTRSSTVLVSEGGEILITERIHMPSGAAAGETRSLILR